MALVRAMARKERVKELLGVGAFICLASLSCGSDKVMDQMEINNKLIDKTEEMRPFCAETGRVPDVWAGTSNDGEVTIYGRCVDE